MELAVFSQRELPTALCAMWTVANANGSVTPAEHQLLEVIAQLHGAALPELGPIDAEWVAKEISDPHRRKRLVQRAIVTAMVDGEPTREQDEAVRALGEALGQEERGVELLHDLASKHQKLARFDLMRRMFGSAMMGETTLERMKEVTTMIRS